MSNGQLKALAERIERLMDERDGIQSDIRDIFAEAKSAGYVPKVLRKAIMRKRMDASKRDEEDAILELYEGALGAVGKAVAAVRAGSTWKEASAEHGVPRATLARAVKAVSIQRNDTDDKITEEFKPKATGSSLSSGLDVATAKTSRVASDEIAGVRGEGCGPVLADSASSERGHEPRQSATPAGPSPPPQPLSHTTGDDGLELPRHLDRRVSA